MSERKDSGGSAFPVQETWIDCIDEDGDKVNKMTQEGSLGMTLRDYFAAAAMQGLIISNLPIGRVVKTGENSLELISERAYFYADAMLAERSK